MPGNVFIVLLALLFMGTHGQGGQTTAGKAAADRQTAIVNAITTTKCPGVTKCQTNNVVDAADTNETHVCIQMSAFLTCIDNDCKNANPTSLPDYTTSKTLYSKCTTTKPPSTKAPGKAAADRQTAIVNAIITTTCPGVTKCQTNNVVDAADTNETHVCIQMSAFLTCIDNDCKAAIPTNLPDYTTSKNLYSQCNAGQFQQTSVAVLLLVALVSILG